MAGEISNATVIQRAELNPDLIIVRVRPDGPLFDFKAGQYTVLGLPGSSLRAAFSDPETEPSPPERLIRRAYSISSSSRQNEYIEFFISLVRSGQLTPRLFVLEEGDRIWMGSKAVGRFTLSEVDGSHDLLLISTGTGLAPYISMIRSAHRCGVLPIIIAPSGNSKERGWHIPYPVLRSWGVARRRQVSGAKPLRIL